MRYTALLFATILFALTGCASMIMPYSDTPLCQKGAAAGYCGSITEVYEITNSEVRQSVSDKRKVSACAGSACSGRTTNIDSPGGQR